MRKPVLTTILILAIVNVAPAKQEQKSTPDQFAATVREVKGNCYVRDNEAAKPRKVKVDDQLREGQQLQCEVKAHVKIRFRASGAEKEIQSVRPDWYPVPNVLAASKSTDSRIAGRRKGKYGARTPQGTPVDEKNRESLPPTTGDFDAADMYWKGRQKYFLLVAASKSDGSATNLQFTSVDAKEVSKAFTRLGYQPLGPGMLGGEAATAENFISELQKIRMLPANALVIVYYSGHAAADPSGKDLWLQLYGQKKFGDHYGLSIDDLIGSARGTTYKGELSVILDTCFSGRAANSTQLKESENTVVFTSSSYQQPSVSMNVPGGGEMSAFTYYLIHGLTDEWNKVDGDEDGIIMYSDLDAYIGNRLTEQFRERTLLGPMQPQLFGGFNKNWVGYDATRARNFNTEPRRTVQLERAVQLQDPDVTRRMLSTISSANSDSYLRALKALDKKKYDDAMSLLDAAEKEGRVAPAQIYWARATVKMEQTQFGAVREWLDKAVTASTSTPNADLIAYDAAMNFMSGNWPKAEELFKQVLQLPPAERLAEDDEDDHISPPLTLFFLSLINLFQGDMVEADLYLKRLKEIDPKELESEEEGASFTIPLLEVLSDVIQKKMESAKRKLEALRRSGALETEGTNWKQLFDRLVQIIETTVTANETGKTDATMVAEHFRQWDTALQQKQADELLLILYQTPILAASSKEILHSKQTDELLARTVAFARERKDQTVTTEVKNINNVQVTEVKGDEKEYALESATLLAAAGQLYAVKHDSANAEKVLKEAIAIAAQVEGGAALSPGAVMQLAELYQEAHRFTEAETQIKNLLKNLREPLGEENLYTHLIQNALGKLYQDWKRPQDAEAAYRESLRLALALGSDSVFAIGARQTLADFLVGSNNNAEASQLYEVAIRNLEQGPAHNPLFEDETRGDLYFSLSKSYYMMGNFAAAEKSLSKTYTIFSSAAEPNLVNVLDCLEWQWGTASQLKKQDDMNVFHKKMVDAIEPELAKPKPDESLGAEVLKIAYSSKDWDVEKSEQFFQFALKAQQKIYGLESAQVAQVWDLWAELKEKRGQFSTAITYLTRGQELYQKQTPVDPARLSNVKYKMGFYYFERQEFEQARASLKDSTDLLAKIADPNAEAFSRNQWPKYLLGIVERYLHNYDAAKSIIVSILETDQNALPLELESVTADYLELAVIARLKGESAEAHDWLAKAVRNLDQTPADKWSRRRAKYAHERGMLALANGDRKQAEVLLREAVEKGSKDPQMDRLVLADFTDDLALVLHQRHKDKDAVELETKAKEMRDKLRNGG